MRRLLAFAVVCLITTASVAWGAADGHLLGKHHRPSHRHTKTHRATRQRKRRAPKRTTKLSATPAARAGSTPANVLLGDQRVESSVDNNAGGTAEAFPFTGKLSGQAQVVDVYIDSHNAATTLIAGLYADNGGQPGTRLASGTLSSPQGGAWNVVQIPSTTVTAGHTYWLAILGKGGVQYFRDQAGGACESVNSAQSSLSSLPSTFSSGLQWNTCPVSAYVGGTTATAVAAGGGTSAGSPVPPVNTATPQVTGTPTEGQTLTTSDGSWTTPPTSYAYQWQACNTLGLACSSIAGATGKSLTLTGSQVGDTVRAIVTGTTSAGSTPASSAQTATVAAQPVPVNTATPQVSGTATQGQTLSVSNGSWSNSPTGYGYQWQDCDRSGANCSSISGATSSSHQLGSGDVGHELRAIVTATNGGGSAQTTSTASPAVASSAPAAPTAAFSYSPSAPVTGQTVQFNAGASSCPGTPCTYTWADDPPSGGSWSLGSGATLSYTFTDTGTKYVTLTVTDSASRTATVEHNVVVSAASSPAPSNTAAPAISGTPQQGQTLTTSNGSWNGSPTAYAYQWQDCDSSGANCANIAGATSSSYTLASSDVGHTLVSVVTASNSGGSATKASSPSGQVTAASSGGGGGGGSSSQTLNCFAAPGACGYPDPNYGNVGVPSGTTLTASGDLVITQAGTVINGLNISGPAPVVQIEANNVTIENSKITATSGGCGTQNTCGNQVVAISHNGGTFYTGTHLTHDEITAANGTTIEYAIHCACGGGQASTELDHLYVHGVDGALWTYGGGYLHDNYFKSEEFIASDHLEDIYCPGNQVTDLTVVHDTQLNTNNSVASGVFCDTNGGQGGTCSNHITMKNNLLAGGGYAIYACGNASSVGSSQLDFENNDLARCTTNPIAQASDGGYDCQGQTSTAPGSGADSHGYWPYGGHYGVDSYTWCPGTAGQTWSGNFWDDNGSAVAC